MFKRETRLTHLSPWRMIPTRAGGERRTISCLDTEACRVNASTQGAGSSDALGGGKRYTHTQHNHTRSQGTARGEPIRSPLAGPVQTTADQTQDRSRRASFFTFASSNFLHPSPHHRALSRYAQTWHIQRNVRRPQARDTLSATCNLRNQGLCTFSRQFPGEMATHLPNGCFREGRGAWAASHLVTL